MKNKLAAALDFPRDCMKSGIDIQNCIHGGNYDKNDILCAMCETVEECLWLHKNDECVATEQKPAEQLLDSLLFPLDYIDMQLARAGHNVGQCACDACSWLRNTEALVSAYQQA